MYFTEITGAIGSTPLVELQRLSPNKKVKILVKLEGQNPGGSASIKDRIVCYMLAAAERSGELTKDKIILEATSGNTGISLAWLGMTKGYRVAIVMPDTMSVERRQLIKIYGAELILTDGKYGVMHSINTARKMAADDHKYYMPDQFSNPANPLAHYETTGVEILADCPYKPIDAVVAGIGTGGTVTGTARRLKEVYPDIKVYGVEPPVKDAIQGLRCLEEYVPPIMDVNLLEERAKVTSREAAAAGHALLEQEGIFAGESSGAVIHKAIKLAEEMESGTIVCILADGGWKYLSLPMWQR
jgi:cysteine synthase B